MMPPRKIAKPAAVEITPSVQEERFFIDPKAISQHLYCQICSEVYLNPLRAPCGHSYCEKCITAWLQSNHTCPGDRRNLKRSDLHEDFLLKNLVGELKAACPWRPLGCDFVAPLAICHIHKNDCVHNPTSMPEVLRDYCGSMIADATNKIMEKSMARVMPACKTVISNAALSLNRGTSSNSTVDSGGSSSSMPTPAEVDEDVFTVPNITLDIENDPMLSTIDAEEEDDEDVPPAEIPPLRLRVYIQGQQETREALCNLLSGSSATSAAKVASNAPSLPKRPRVDI